MLFQGLLKKVADLKKQGKDAFHILMAETSDEMQDLAMSFGERNTIETCINRINSLKN